MKPVNKEKVEYKKPSIQKIVMQREKTIVLGGCQGWK